MDELRDKLIPKVAKYLSTVTEKEVTLSNEGTDHKNSYNVYVSDEVLMYIFSGGHKAKFVIPYEGMLFAEKEYYDEVIELIKEG